MSVTNFPPEFSSVIGQISLDDMHIQQAFEFYHQEYKCSDVANEFVLHSGRISQALRGCEFIGFCNRTMGKHIPLRRSYEGAAIRGSLYRSGLLKASGHELFRGCVVFPELDAKNQVVSAVGYRIASRIRGWESPVIYWTKEVPQSFEVAGMNVARELI